MQQEQIKTFKRCDIAGRDIKRCSHRSLSQLQRALSHLVLARLRHEANALTVQRMQYAGR